MQGIKDSGRKFYKLIKSIFGKIGVHSTSVDGSFYAFVYKEKRLVFLCSETDDVLILTSCEEAQSIIQDELKKAFCVTIKSSTRINSLKFKIMQIKYGVSMDQTDHILDMVNKHFQDPSSIRKTDTPLRTDKQYENEIQFDNPVSPSKLKAMVKQ